MTEMMIKQVGPMTVAYLPMLGDYSQTPAGYTRLYEWVGRHGLQPSEAPLAVYLTIPGETPPEEWAWELWAPVKGDVAEAEPDDAGVGVKHVPGHEVLSALYQGPYDGVEPVYNEMWQWIGSNYYEPDGPPMERYLNGPDEVSSPDEFLTEILMPVKHIPPSEFVL